MSSLNFSLRNLFAIGILDLQPLKMEVRRRKEKVAQIQTHTDGYCGGHCDCSNQITKLKGEHSFGGGLQNPLLSLTVEN